jgi:hypothetical protein
MGMSREGKSKKEQRYQHFHGENYNGDI